ncbi:UNVERIFIED_ORG: hypothetical protein QE434_002502, partial [Rhizobium sp. SORGH_AS 755]|nr:hypothetical protein [Rhizobium sp. SORGH_AS_0755]
PFEVIATGPKTSLIAKMPWPPEDVIEEAFSSVMEIPPRESTLMAVSKVDKPKPGCVTTATGAEERISTDGSMPVEALEQLQVWGPEGSQLPANDGEYPMSNDVNTDVATIEMPLNEGTKPVAQGAMPPAIPLCFPTRPPRMSVFPAVRISLRALSEPTSRADRSISNNPLGAIIQSPPLSLPSPDQPLGTIINVIVPVESVSLNGCYKCLSSIKH